MKLLTSLLIAGFLLLGCGGDEGRLTSAEREWCAFVGASEDDARKFDIIFEKGLELNLGMDVVNANAAELRSKYEADGMSADEAVAAVFIDLLEFEDFVTACKAAFASDGGG